MDLFTFFLYGLMILAALSAFIVAITSLVDTLKITKVLRQITDNEKTDRSK